MSGASRRKVSGWARAVLFGVFATMVLDQGTVQAAVTGDTPVTTQLAFRSGNALKKTWVRKRKPLTLQFVDITTSSRQIERSERSFPLRKPTQMIGTSHYNAPSSREISFQTIASLPTDRIPSEEIPSQDSQSISKEVTTHSPDRDTRANVVETTVPKDSLVSRVKHSPSQEIAPAAQDKPVAQATLPKLSSAPGVSSPLGNRIVDIAKKYIGTPYIWGGTTPSGFDCSGFTQFVARQVGVSIPRTTWEQFNIGRPISESSLQPGDLVFFSTDAPGVSHVGIYIGGGQFIHADAQRGIFIASFNGPYWHNVYVGARRLSP